MPTVKLTPTFVRSLRCTGNRKIDYFDTAQRGFMLEVRPSGGKTYYQRYIDGHGRERQFKIGPADVLTLDQARRKALSVLKQAIIGTDPQDKRAEQRTIPTLAEFAHANYLPHVQGYKRSWRCDEVILRLHILPALGRLALDEVKQEHIADLLSDMRKRGYVGATTNRSLVLLRYMFNLARKWKTPGVRENPTAGLALAPEVQRQRFLSPAEIGRLVAAIETDENRVAAQAITLLLLTGARKSEVTKAKWEYVDWDKCTLFVPIAKSGRPRAIALSAAAVDLLRSVERVAGNPYVFLSPMNGKPCLTLQSEWERISRRAGLTGVRLHDLRHTYASFLINKGVSLFVVQGLLGHASAKTTQRYAHLAPKTLLDAAEIVGTLVGGNNERLTS